MIKHKYLISVIKKGTGMERFFKMIDMYRDEIGLKHVENMSFIEIDHYLDESGFERNEIEDFWSEIWASRVNNNTFKYNNHEIKSSQGVMGERGLGGYTSHSRLAFTFSEMDYSKEMMSLSALLRKMEKKKETLGEKMNSYDIGTKKRATMMNKYLDLVTETNLMRQDLYYLKWERA